MKENRKAQVKHLKDIKSLYVLKKMFSFLYENQKLKIIIYSKYLQNIFGIDIEYYKNISGVYKIIEKNGNGKEYELDTNILIFNGEYLNGKRHGIGIEFYDNGELKFEGKYLNGKRHGIGKEYDDNGEIVFEGEYLNGKRWNGKVYSNDDDYLEFELKNGCGKIKEYKNNFKIKYERDIKRKLVFEGEYVNGKGIGKEFWNNRLIFDGEYLNGERNGIGKEYEYYGELIFDGEYLNGKRHGIGKEYDHEGELKFEGEYLNGKRWNGKAYNYDGILEYELKNGCGKIKEYDDYGRVLLFEGEFLNGKRNGIGKEHDKYSNLIFF